MRERLENLLETVRKELGAVVDLQPGVVRPDLPSPLADFYSISNGLRLPFADLFQADAVERRALPGWLVFGADPYAAMFLCRTAAPWDLDIWDHESGEPPEGGISDVVSLLAEVYEAHWESQQEGSIVVEAIPQNHAMSVVQDLKAVAPHATSAALLAGLRSLPFAVEVSDPTAGIIAIRRLHSREVACRWRAGRLTMK